MAIILLITGLNSYKIWGSTILDQFSLKKDCICLIRSSIRHLGIVSLLYIIIGVVPIKSAILSTENSTSKSYNSVVALIGGGATFQPGEISLAHNGVLFLDELPEFKRNVLEVLRQPMEDRVVTIARAKQTIEFPASFMLVAAMNPCPCGYYNHPTHRCDCSPGQIQRYMNKISGPLLDRIDLQCEIMPLSFEEISKASPGEPSSVIRERVMRARNTQAQRFASIPGVHCNAQMSEKHLREYCTLDADSSELLRMAMERLQLSARAYSRILKVARTIADLDNSENIQSHHIAEAIGYRNLDRESWGHKSPTGTTSLFPCS